MRDWLQALAPTDCAVIGQDLMRVQFRWPVGVPRMETSRSQIGSLLDPTDGNVTLAPLQRAAEIIGRKVRLDLV